MMATTRFVRRALLALAVAAVANAGGASPAGGGNGWAGRDFEPSRFSYREVIGDMGALSDLYACFFRDGLCVVEGMPTTPEETSGHHYALRERLLGKDWAGWTASKPFWASINNRTPSLLQRQTVA